nr:MAG TPA: hypothetical protein [Herelleviridae sp.]
MVWTSQPTRESVLYATLLPTRQATSGPVPAKSAFLTVKGDTRPPRKRST